MLVVSEKIKTFFTAQSAFTAAMGTKIFPVFASENTGLPFATYMVDRVEFKSKDADQYDVTVYFWFDQNNYNAMAEFMDDILPAIKNEFDWQGSTMDFIEDSKAYVGIINFLIN